MSDHVFVRLTGLTRAPTASPASRAGPVHRTAASHRRLVTRPARVAAPRPPRPRGPSVAHDPQGFLKYDRVDTPKRPAAERVRDWQPIYLRARDEVVSEQAARCMDCGVAFCHSGCPLGNLIPEWNEFVARDDYVGASERLHATNNFPEFTGWICPAPCEAACVLALNTDPVTIKQVEISIVERAFDDRASCCPSRPLERTGKRVAVIGSGPGRARRGAAAHPGRARGHRLRARRPPRRPAALRHPRLQDAQGHHRPPARADARRGHRVRRQRAHRRRRRAAAARRVRRGRARRRRARAARADHAGPRTARRAPGDGVPAAGQSRAGRRHRGAGHRRRRQGRDHHRRRRHRGRLPRHGQPAGRRARSPCSTTTRARPRGSGW